MNMKKKIFILTFSLISISNVSASDSLKIVNLQREVSNLKSSVSRLQQENGKIRGVYQQQKAIVDSLLLEQKQQTENLNVLADKVGANISETNKNLEASTSSLSASINNRTRMAVCGILIAIVLLGIVYFILRKKILSGTSSINKIKVAQESLENAQKAMLEESVKLDNKLVEFLDKQVASQPQNNNNDQPDHSLALKVATEVARIENNLSKMDPSVKGYKQLSSAVKKIRNNFLAYGYEIVEMIGKPYSEGIKASVSFETDESLADGEQRITRIIVPQVNYNGKMIQAAQITVSQNI